MPDIKISQSDQPSANLPLIDLRENPPKPAKPLESNEIHWLIIEDDKGRREIPLGGEIYSMGRDPSCDIRLFSMFVSRRHATLVRIDREVGNYDYQIVDGDLEGNVSSNGIVINSRKVTTHSLKHKDEVVFACGVKAKYYLIKRDETKAGSNDPFDITLIDPAMIDE
ncbi:MAG TPA: phosphopeptide-binding protein [Cyanobacteria bacterium UBA8803]|nr:phosphopeptide-binding protein [Cyanobacteria bacterium UBA9273]HBL59119.1 phosphopeptide-binding protein [Cyanobacteria bacterium UBA8803]